MADSSEDILAFHCCRLRVALCVLGVRNEGRKEMFYLTTLSTHFIYMLQIIISISIIISIIIIIIIVCISIIISSSSSSCCCGSSSSSSCISSSSSSSGSSSNSSSSSSICKADNKMCESLNK